MWTTQLRKMPPTQGSTSSESKVSAKAFQASELHKKNLEKTKILRQQLEDMEATNDLSADAAEEAQVQFAEATEKLNEKIKEIRAKKQKEVPTTKEDAAVQPAVPDPPPEVESIRKEMAAKDREIAELKALMRKFLDKTFEPAAPATEVTREKASGGGDERDEEVEGGEGQQDGPKAKTRRLAELANQDI